MAADSHAPNYRATRRKLPERPLSRRVLTEFGHHGINPLSRTGLADFERILGLSPD
jgi:hypothetical protein